MSIYKMLTSQNKNVTESTWSHLEVFLKALVKKNPKKQQISNALSHFY